MPRNFRRLLCVFFFSGHCSRSPFPWSACAPRVTVALFVAVAIDSFLLCSGASQCARSRPRRAAGGSASFCSALQSTECQALQGYHMEWSNDSPVCRCVHTIGVAVSISHTSQLSSPLRLRRRPQPPAHSHTPLAQSGSSPPSLHSFHLRHGDRKWSRLLHAVLPTRCAHRKLVSFFIPAAFHSRRGCTRWFCDSRTNARQETDALFRSLRKIVFACVCVCVCVSRVQAGGPARLRSDVVDCTGHERGLQFFRHARRAGRQTLRTAAVDHAHQLHHCRARRCSRECARQQGRAAHVARGARRSAVRAQRRRPD